MSNRVYSIDTWDSRCAYLAVRADIIVDIEANSNLIQWIYKLLISLCGGSYGEACSLSKYFNGLPCPFLTEMLIQHPIFGFARFQINRVSLSAAVTRLKEWLLQAQFGDDSLVMTHYWWVQLIWANECTNQNGFNAVKGVKAWKFQVLAELGSMNFSAGTLDCHIKRNSVLNFSRNAWKVFILHSFYNMNSCLISRLLAG